ncbi:MAG: hypothetical protein JO148_10155 [Acidimicrobiia bacterium]|nr:hypothetical protein [Acidimicrobiia bacterium]
MPEVPTTLAGPTFPSTSTSPTTDAAVRCDQTVADVKTAIVNGLNSIDADPKTESKEGKTIFAAFARMDSVCKAQASTALSDVIQFLSTQANGRKPNTQQAVNAALTAVCKSLPQGVTLTPDAQATCAAHP